MRPFMRAVFRTVLTGLLFIVSQIVGMAYLVGLFFPRRLLAVLVAYGALSVSAIAVAPQTGRVPLPCWSEGTLKSQSVLYCLLHRHYVVPELREVAQDLADAVDAQFPGTVTLTLDASLPFGNFPLVPHLSHNDGRKLDLAFYYGDETGYRPGATRSPIGYFAFEEGPTACEADLPTMRWNLEWLQPFWHDLSLEVERTRFAVQWLADDPRVTRIFLEPHLAQSLGLSSPKIRFQGCNAARHDDHIHFEI
ncbi:hypothetical protein [Pelagibacterium mangrovi]|uniref:hypothetical protein n=1 Tax=Pelagibacterium mangrovi TaxID=3119828 RepID=UPI002FC80E27